MVSTGSPDSLFQTIICCKKEGRDHRVGPRTRPLPLQPHFLTLERAGSPDNQVLAPFNSNALGSRDYWSGSAVLWSLVESQAQRVWWG